MMRVRFSLGSLDSKQLLSISSLNSQSILMTNYASAFELIKNTYDLDTLKEIRDHGCISGAATEHIYYSQTVDFYDEHEEEIVEFIRDNLGEEHFAYVMEKAEGNLKLYKNDLTWCFVEFVAMQLLDEFETTMIEYEQECSDQMLSTLRV